MSLLHRASSVESFRRRATSPESVDSARRPSIYQDLQQYNERTRKLSFSPIPVTKSPEVQINETVGAFEVSAGKRIAQVTVAVLYCLFAAGIVFGYAAIKPVLISEGVYRSECTQKELDRNVDVCYKQELRMNLMFTIAAVSTNVCALPVGTILDQYGPRAASLIGSVFITIGCFFMAFANTMPPSLDGYIIGYACLAIGGPFIFISSFQLSNTFPRYSGLILALLTGAFDTSSAVFLVYRIIYTNSSGTIKPRRFFLIYLIVPAFILVANIFLMPAKSYKTVGEMLASAEAADEEAEEEQEQEQSSRSPLLSVNGSARRPSSVTEITALLGGESDASALASKEASVEQRSGVWGAMHGCSAAQQIRSPWFALITLFTLLQMTRINYFVATVRSQYTYLLDSAASARQVNDVFDIALPLGGVLAIPFVGLILDNTSTAFVLGLLVTLATLIGILGLIAGSFPAAYANIALFVVYRPFYYTAVSDYSAKVFGFATFGKVYGMIICLAGLFNFSQSALDALTFTVYDRDPRPANVLLLLLAATAGSCLVAYVAVQAKRMRRRGEIENEAERARPSPMPGVSGEGWVNGGSGGYGT